MGCASSTPGTTFQTKEQRNYHGTQYFNQNQNGATPQQQQQQPPPQQQQQQQVQAMNAPQAQPTEQPVQKPVEVVNTSKLDKKTLERYLELEKQTREAESENVVKTLSAKKDELKDLLQSIQQQENSYKQLAMQTAKEKADVDQIQDLSVRGYFKDQAQYDQRFTKEQKEKKDVEEMQEASVRSYFQQMGSYDEQLSKEQEEYLEALNKQEIAKKELDANVRHKEQLEAEIKAMEGQAGLLLNIQSQYDKLLESIFNGKYGSELEYELECQVDMLLDRKQRISVARYKWQNSRVLLQHAVNQLAFAVKRWGELDRVRSDNMQVKYTMATETRNNVIAASQNVTSAHRYLQTIEFPYCKQPEMETLNRAVNNIYSDMQTSERHKHAMQCYGTTHKRAAALLQWFDHVINTTIEKDYEKAKDDVDVKGRELRAERVELIRARIDDNTSTVGMEIDEEVIKKTDQPPMEMHATEADQVSTAGDIEMPELAEEEAPTAGEELASEPTPLPLNELAPLPDESALFGDIDELKKQHEQEMQEFKKTQEVNKARMEQGLQEKLRARRSRQVREDQAQTED